MFILLLLGEQLVRNMQRIQRFHPELCVASEWHFAAHGNGTPQHAATPGFDLGG